MEAKYDEFGNYLGPELPSDESDNEEYSVESDGEADAVDEDQLARVASAAAEAIHEVPFEERQHYPDAEEVYKGAEVLVQEEDTQPIDQPIVAPLKANTFDLMEIETPETTFSFQFLRSMMDVPSLVRHVCVVGHLHHGKTCLTDMLVAQTHTFKRGISRRDPTIGDPGAQTGPNRASLRSRKEEAHTRALRYTDCRADEQERGLSIKACPLSLVLPDSRGKSLLMNVFDTPGHVNFLDDTVAAMRLCDGAVVCVDVLEGPMVGTRKVVEAALTEGLDIVLVVNCIDRLVLELRLPPTDAYHKIRYVIKEVNDCITRVAEMLGIQGVPTLSPNKGNVAFAAGEHNLFFTLESFARLYAPQLHSGIQNPLTPATSVAELARFLWGDVWWNPVTGRFQPHEVKDWKEDEPPERSFVDFVLKPLYKILAHVVGEERPTLEPTLKELNIVLDPTDYFLDTRSLLKQVCLRLTGDSSALVDMITKHVRSPEASNAQKVLAQYQGNQTSAIAQGMKRLDPAARLMVMTTKNYHRPDGGSFDLLGRVMSGTIKQGDFVRVLGESYSSEDDEDMLIREVSHLWILQGRYRIEVKSVPAGNWVLIGGVDPSVRKTATLTSLRDNDNGTDDVEIFRKLQFPTTPVIRVACEPLNPSELPKMLDGLRCIERAYPLLQTKVEDSGEHVIIGTGELYLDCALHDLRHLYGDLEIKSSDPIVTICETITETSATQAVANTPNRKNRFSILAEPLQYEVGSAIENGVIGPHIPSRPLADLLNSRYGWDMLEARSLWAFGANKAPNVLINEVFPDPEQIVRVKNNLESAREFIVHGFQWATREGPLVEEAVRNSKFKLLNASLSSNAVERNGGQIIPTIRRAAYSAFLLATPRLMEPMLFAEISCPADCVPAILNVLTKRRGHLTKDLANPGTPIEILHAFIPAIDSFGFETDIRTHTSGQAFVLTLFDSWQTLPGDPLDDSVLLHPLEPSPVAHLAREFLLKLRRRKGLTPDISMSKFFDDEMLQTLQSL